MQLLPMYAPEPHTPDILKCTSCGALRRKEENEKIVRCDSCGSTTFFTDDVRYLCDTW